MRADGPSRGRGVVTALVLAGLVLVLGWVSIRTAMVRTLPAESASLTTIAPHDPDVVLSRATLALVAQRGILKPAMLAAVRRAAQTAPLDARAYLVLGHQQLLDDQPARAVRTLEAGQRLDPRNRLIHLLLVDRYLRTGRYSDAAEQFAMSSRLVGPAQGAIAKAMAEMSLAPDTRDAVRRTLASDPGLERSVLIALAKSDAAPSTIFAIATPAGRSFAGGKNDWGPILIERLVAQGQYGSARSVWEKVYRLNAADVKPLVFDAGFRELPGSPPFNWALTTTSLGTADISDGALSINYYGRDTGDLASQLLVLAPGTYRFAITIEGSKTGTNPPLSWSLRCVTGSKTEVMNLAASATGAPHRIAAGFTVPADCPAQRLTLIGNSSEFPAPINVMLRDLDLRRAGATR